MSRTSQKNKRSAKESGQAAVFLVLAMGLFLIGSMGFVVDGANLWFHRQSAQTAVDAACNAGAMNMLSHAAAPSSNDASWLDGLSPKCPTGTSTIAPCAYAFLNGYSGSSVSVSPDTFTGLDDKDCDYINPVCNPRDHDLVSSPYLQVVINDQIPTTFMRLVGARPTVSVSARSTCGLSNVLSPVPVLVLNPNAPKGSGVNSTLQGSGSLSVAYTVSVPKNPTKLIQVNSSDPDAVTNLSGTVTLNNADDSAGNFAVAGQSKPTADGSYTAVNAAGIVSDPFAIVDAPSQGQAQAQGIAPVTYGTTGCPGIPAGVPCDDYKPGYYPPILCPSLGTTAAICVGKGLVRPNQTGLAVFEPGVYYLAEDLFAASPLSPSTPGASSCLRSATTGGDNSGGTMFYFAGQAVLNVTSGSGTLTETDPISGATIFDCGNSNPSWAVSATAATCPGGNLNLPAGVTTFTGNVLLAPCKGKYGDPSGANQVRGMLFFQERDVQPVNAATWSGSNANSFALVGNIYLHNCVLDQSGDSGANCDPNAFQETLNLGSNGYIVGGIVVDQLHINSGANVTVVLNPNPQYYTLKASLLQ